LFYSLHRKFFPWWLAMGFLVWENVYWTVAYLLLCESFLGGEQSSGLRVDVNKTMAEGLFVVILLCYAFQLSFFRIASSLFNVRYDTIEEINVDSKAEYTA